MATDILRAINAKSRFNRLSSHIYTCVLVLFGVWWAEQKKRQNKTMCVKCKWQSVAIKKVLCNEVRSVWKPWIWLWVCWRNCEVSSVERVKVTYVKEKKSTVRKKKNCIVIFRCNKIIIFILLSSSFLSFYFSTLTTRIQRCKMLGVYF